MVLYGSSNDNLNIVEPVGATNNKQITDVSLLTGKIRKIGIDEDEVTNKDGTLIKNISSDLVTSSGMSCFANSYKHYILKLNYILNL